MQVCKPITTCITSKILIIIKILFMLIMLIMFSRRNCPVYYRIINFTILLIIIIGKTAERWLSRTTAMAC